MELASTLRGRRRAPDAPTARRTPVDGHARTRGSLPDGDLMPGQLRAEIVLCASLLDEPQRGLFASLESPKCGCGDDRRRPTRRPTAWHIDPSTLAVGRPQQDKRDVHVDWVRRAGGGRRPTEEDRRVRPNRNEQFDDITELHDRCPADHVPVISVDPENEGTPVNVFRNPGAKWGRKTPSRGTRPWERTRRCHRCCHFLRPANWYGSTTADAASC